MIDFPREQRGDTGHAGKVRTTARRYGAFLYEKTADLAKVARDALRPFWHDAGKGGIDDLMWSTPHSAGLGEPLELVDPGIETGADAKHRALADITSQAQTGRFANLRIDPAAKRGVYVHFITAHEVDPLTSSGRYFEVFKAETDKRI